MRSLNAIELLNLIRENGRISRASLAKVSRLSKPTVSEVVNLLIQRNLVKESGEGNSSARGGKKPTFVEFNAGFGKIAAAEVGPELIRFILCDLAGHTLKELSLPTEGKLDGHTVAQLIKRGFRRILKAASGRVLTLAVATPGIVDCNRGLVLETDNVFGWRNLDLGDQLAQNFGIPVYLDNDVNMAALAELNSGLGRSRRNFVLIRINTGIGAGIVLDGKVHHGAHWATGEIGHMLLNIKGEPPRPNPRGYLESVVGMDRIAERVRRLAGRRGPLKAEIAKNSELEAIIAAAKCRDSQAAALVNEIVDHLGSAVANVVATFDPELVILLGEPGLAFIDGVREVVARVIPWPVEIRPSQIGDGAALKGAVTAALNTAYEQISQSFNHESAAEFIDPCESDAEISRAVVAV